MVAVAPGHTVALFTETVGAEETVNITDDDTDGHDPAGSSVVKVKVTVPLFPGIGVNITVEGLVVAMIELNCDDAFVMVPVTPVMLHVPVLAEPPILDPVNE
jgi:hypothetical protein